MLTVAVLAITLTGCGISRPGDPTPVASVASLRPSAVGIACRQARAAVKVAMGAVGPLNCRKAHSWALTVPRRSGARQPPAVSHASPSLRPWSTPTPFPDARQIDSYVPAIQQFEQSGTTITSLWADLENGLDVQIEGASLDGDSQQGVIIILITNDDTSNSARISGYAGGTYPTPEQAGPITLTKITGSLAARNMMISFSYRGGEGTFEPRTSQFTMS